MGETEHTLTVAPGGITSAKHLDPVWTKKVFIFSSNYKHLDTYISMMMAVVKKKTLFVPSLKKKRIPIK